MSGGVVGREGKLAALPWFQREMGGLALQTIEALVPYIQDIRDPTNKIMSQWEKEISPTTGTARDLRLHQLHFAGAISPEEEV